MVLSGGSNKAGTYQFVTCYSDVRANKITDYFFVSNPIPLFDQPIAIPTDYPVAKSFKIRLSNLNTDFKYFNLAVLKTINNTTTPYLIGTFEINSSIFEYIYTGQDKIDLTIDDILGKRPLYNKGKGITESNGYSFQWNLEEDRVLNLQPVINNITPFWQTVEMNEGDYANPILAQNYTGYLGDEVYAKGISFTKTNGKSTNIFPFIGRNHESFDVEDVSYIPCPSGLSCPSGISCPSGYCENPDVFSSSACNTGDIPHLRWQVYNTAFKNSDNPNCVSFVQNIAPTTIVDDVECYSEQVFINSIFVDPNTGKLPKIQIHIFGNICQKG